jgi:hypothetical protein
MLEQNNIVHVVLGAGNMADWSIMPFIDVLENFHHETLH